MLRSKSMAAAIRNSKKLLLLICANLLVKIKSKNLNLPIQKSDNLIQLADMVVGALAALTEKQISRSVISHATAQSLAVFNHIY